VLAEDVAPVLTEDKYTCSVVLTEEIILVVETKEKRTFCRYDPFTPDVNAKKQLIPMVPGAVVLTFAAVVEMSTFPTFGISVQMGEVLAGMVDKSEC